MKLIKTYLAVVLTALSLTACGGGSGNGEKQVVVNNPVEIPRENPLNEEKPKDVGEQGDYITINKSYYTIVYDKAKKGAVKVTYSLNREKINSGNIKKRPKFYHENSLGKQYQTYYTDYTNTGYDRGHLANDASFDWSEESQKSTYSMANIVPMHPKVNRGGWLAIEDYERYLTNQFQDVDVVNIISYNDEILKKKPIDEILVNRNFDSEGHKQKYIEKYNKSANYLNSKKIYLPQGFYKTITSKRKDYKECFFIENKESNKEKDERLYSIDCENVPKI